jgi:hypothetical protein
MEAAMNRGRIAMRAMPIVFGIGLFLSACAAPPGYGSLAYGYDEYGNGYDTYGPVELYSRDHGDRGDRGWGHGGEGHGGFRHAGLGGRGGGGEHGGAGGHR